MLRNKLIVAALSITFIACGGGSGTNTSNAGTSNAGNTGSANQTAANDPLATTKTKTDESANNSAPTLTPVVKAYCDAWVKNDEAAMRKVLSSEAIKYFENEMKAEKEKSLLKFLEDERVSGTPCDAYNETINGDTATVMVKTNKTPNGVKRLFVKEHGEWKLSNKVPDIDSVRSATNTNSAKK